MAVRPKVVSPTVANAYGVSVAFGSGLNEVTMMENVRNEALVLTHIFPSFNPKP